MEPANEPSIGELRIEWETDRRFFRADDSENAEIARAEPN